ncbi:MAG: hypothetical protein GY904_30845 [Planctomycetaceae bacterium]|nr:hypothetical protein [Planctomycetaceae bacterium]
MVVAKQDVTITFTIREEGCPRLSVYRDSDKQLPTSSGDIEVRCRVLAGDEVPPLYETLRFGPNENLASPLANGTELFETQVSSAITVGQIMRREQHSN